MCKHPGWCARTGVVTAAAVACGYWASQIYATYFVGEAQMRMSSWIVAALCLGAFLILFVVRVFRPWSKAAAILGLCSFAAFVGLIWYDTGPVLLGYAMPVWAVILISTVFGVAGVALDVERCWRLGSHALSESLWLKLGHKARAAFRHAFHPNHPKSL
ncbi:MAG TPA: hypothetical protein VGY56_16255 [Verrucomicrobiae bacterium]|nr:hypothetical protein [Verrucomicrobiae bacterium]